LIEVPRLSQMEIEKLNEEAARRVRHGRTHQRKSSALSGEKGAIYDGAVKLAKYARLHPDPAREDNPYIGLSRKRWRTVLDHVADRLRRDREAARALEVVAALPRVRGFHLVDGLRLHFAARTHRGGHHVSLSMKRVQYMAARLVNPRRPRAPLHRPA
jgi:hypothetical protein